MKTKAIPTDRQPPRRDLGDVRGREGERLSEYFDFTQWPEKRDRKVLRGELLAILTRQWRVERESKWYRRMWRYFANKVGAEQEKVG